MRDFDYRAGCCRKLTLHDKIYQIKNYPLNYERLGLLLKLLARIKIIINQPNIIDVCILIHCLKKETYESKALRISNKIEELYAVINEASNLFLQNIPFIKNKSKKWEADDSLEPIIYLVSGLVLKAIENPTGPHIPPKCITNHFTDFISNPDAYWRT